MSVRQDRQFSIRKNSYRCYKAVPSLDSYTSSPLELRLEQKLDFGTQATDIWITNQDIWIRVGVKYFSKYLSQVQVLFHICKYKYKFKYSEYLEDIK